LTFLVPNAVYRHDGNTYIYIYIEAKLNKLEAALWVIKEKLLLPEGQNILNVLGPGAVNLYKINQGPRL